MLNEIIWNNKSIRRDGRPLYRNKIKNKGILRLGDILTLRDYKLKSWDQMKNNGITNAEYFLLMGIYNAIPKDWINVLRTQSNSSNVASSNDNADPPDVSLPSSSRGVYWDLVELNKNSINCCTELFTQIRFFIKWAWYRHLCVTEESLEHLFIAIPQNISGHH